MIRQFTTTIAAKLAGYEATTDPFHTVKEAALIKSAMTTLGICDCGCVVSKGKIQFFRRKDQIVRSKYTHKK